MAHSSRCLTASKEIARGASACRMAAAIWRLIAPLESPPLRFWPRRSIVPTLGKGRSSTRLGISTSLYWPDRARCQLSNDGVADPSNTVTLTASGLSFQAHYNGSSSYTAADGACQTLAASKLSAATQISSSSNPSKVGQSVTFTTQVRSGAMAPTGVVTITVDGAAVPLTLAPSGIATYTTSSLAAGNHTIRAYYSGDSNFNPGTSSQLIQSVRVQYYLPMITKQRQTSVFSLPPAAGILSKGAARHIWLASGNDGAVNIHPGHLT